MVGGIPGLGGADSFNAQEINQLVRELSQTTKIVRDIWTEFNRVEQEKDLRHTEAARQKAIEELTAAKTKLEAALKQAPRLDQNIQQWLQTIDDLLQKLQ